MIARRNQHQPSGHLEVHCNATSVDMPRAFFTLTLLAMLLRACDVAAQQLPLHTQDPEPIGAGSIHFHVESSVAKDEFYPLSGLQGNLWQLPVVGLVVGLSPIADFQISGGPYNRLDITGRSPAPLAGVVTATDATTHAVEDIIIGTRIRLAPETAQRPAFGFSFAVRLPNAKHESGIGQDTTDFSASLLAGKTVGSVRVAVNAGLMIMTEPIDPGKQNDVATYGLSLAVPVSSRAEIRAEVNGRESTRPGIAPIGTESRGIATFGGRYVFGSVSLDVSVLRGVTRIDPTIGASVGLTRAFKAFSLP
jgi:hypothetical protein